MSNSLRKISAFGLSLTTVVTLSGAFMPMAAAQTADELQAQIQTLLNQINSLNSQIAAAGGTTTAAPSITFTRNLTVGSSGADVKALQQFLNSKGFTVSATGAGAPGSESTFFGAKTKAALAKFQAANAISPAVGFFGPITRNFVNSMTVVTPPPTTGTTTPPVVTGSFTVTLSSDSPASGTIVASSTVANLANFTFTNGSASPVKVTKVVLTKGGISGDTTLENVYLFDGAVRITDAASVSVNLINFTNGAGIFTVPANGSKTISVRSDILGSATGQTVSVRIAAATDVVTDPTTTVGGTFPVSGNMMSIASAPTLAGVNFSTSTGVLPSTNTSLNPGTDVTVWQPVAIAINNRDVFLNRLALRMIGSVSLSDIRNFRLQVDGVEVAKADSLDANGFVTFAPTTAAKLTTGSHTLRVLADVVGGSSRTFSFSLRNVADISIVDSSFGVNVRPTVNNTTFVALTSGTQTVASGSITVTKATDSPSGNVIQGGSDVPLARYTMTAFGENVKIETLTVSFTSGATATYRNGRLLMNGVQVGSTGTIAPAGTQFTVNSTIAPGAPVTLEVRADIFDNDGTNGFTTGATSTISLAAGSSNAQGVVSGTLTSVPNAAVPGNAITVTTGAVTLAKLSSYSNQTISIPRTQQKLANFVLSGSSAEDVNLNTIIVDFSTTTGLTDVFVKYGDSVTAVKPTVTGSDDTFSISLALLKNTNLNLEVIGNLSSSFVGPLTTSMSVSGITAASAQSVSSPAAGQLAGQVMTVGTGSISVAAAAATPAAKLAVGNSTADVAAFEFTALNDTFTITEMVVRVTSTSSASVVQNVLLKDGATTLATLPLGNPTATSTTFSGLSIPVSANGTKDMTVAMQFGGVGTNFGDTGVNASTTLVSFKANNSSGVETSTTSGALGNSVVVFKSIPTISAVTLPSTVLAAGSPTIARVQVASDAAGSIGWKRIVFTVSKSAAPVIGATSSMTVTDESGTIIAGTFTASTTLATSTAAATGEIVFIATSEQQVSGSKTYSLQVPVTGTLTAGNNISTSIAQPVTSRTAPAAYASVVTGSFVWTDRSIVPHSEASLDWNDSFLVKNLPLASQTLSI